MKILLITLDFPPDTFGGAGIYANELTKILSVKNEVHVITSGNKSTMEKHGKNVFIHRQKCSFLPFLRLPTFLYQVQKNINHIIEKYKIDVIHSNDLEGCFHLRKLPSVVTIHHISKHNFSKISLSQNLKNLPYPFMEKIAINNATKIIAVSHLTKEQLLNNHSNMEEKTCIIHEPIDYKKFYNKNNSKVKSKYRLKENELIFLCPGMAREERKGGYYLLCALEKLNREFNFLCFITGRSREGRWDQKLRNEVKKKGLEKKVVFTGEVSFEKILEYYAICNIVIFPSVFEGYGLPTLEAMAAGKPVIATKTGESPYFIENLKNGILIDTENSEQLYKVIKLLIQNRNLRKRIARQARIDIKRNLNLDCVREKFEGLYQEILEKPYH